MVSGPSHDRADESAEAKARWFQSLSLEDRMELFCSYTELILENNPDIVKAERARPAGWRIQVVRKAQG